MASGLKQNLPETVYNIDGGEDINKILLHKLI
jgi:hypothetical protein